MRVFLFVLALLLNTWVGISQSAEEKKLEEDLFALPDVSFTKISAANELPIKYMLRIKQPLDHKDRSKGEFYQRVILTHQGYQQPTLMQTQGYELYKGKNELEAALKANHLNIEHRYFGESVPDSIQWKYLTLEQVTADLHKINQLFKPIYKNKWISTGISKGGQTTIFYKFFYPDDVDVSVPYVAPFNEGLEDRRIYTFLDTVGTAACRNKIREFQRNLLKQEDAALEKLKWYAKGAGLQFKYLDNELGKAYELAVLEFSFSFWQWGSKCEEIPGNESLDASLDYLLKVSNIDFFADVSMEKYAPHYYQAASQMGYYGYDIEPFKEELKHFTSNPLAAFYPKDAGRVVYDPALNRKVAAWLKTGGNNMLYIYGGSDTWSADMIIPTSKVNSKVYVLPGKDHGKARVIHMDPAMKKQFTDQLGQWLGIQVSPEDFK